ncbi:MAG: hypothetical protein HOK67_07280 [Deltaproteobacteria bacterium]|jgi:DNA-binding NtrC family response regulator|nr:hypothetical protein [Deltaproteobacteria bacterium]MBT4642901.1 hypothetical protein [Deltaproteobacteria bacterium]MBT6499689.1 hypothetical protein [Deltaproteobacteria bacterium]MBT6613045.1 hypothetical protein [Deltaproteobacteria bacterium]MBT7710602.1 hypothetical protein [Deltaproteobacteria bacterium]
MQQTERRPNPIFMKRAVIVLSKNRDENAAMCSILKDTTYSPKSLFSYDDLEKSLKAEEFLAVFIDTDSIPLDNSSIRFLNKNFPNVSLLLTSVKKSHPDLEEAIGQYVYACISKPIDPEEVIYWLKCILDDKSKPI